MTQIFDVLNWNRYIDDLLLILNDLGSEVGMVIIFRASTATQVQCFYVSCVIYWFRSGSGGVCPGSHACANDRLQLRLWLGRSDNHSLRNDV